MTHFSLVCQNNQNCLVKLWSQMFYVRKSNVVGGPFLTYVTAGTRYLMIENDFSNSVYTTMQIITSSFFRVWTSGGDKTSVWWQDQEGCFFINVKEEAKNKEEPDTCDLETGFHSDILKKQFASLRSLWKLIFKAHFNIGFGINIWSHLCSPEARNKWFAEELNPDAISIVYLS